MRYLLFVCLLVASSVLSQQTSTPALPAHPAPSLQEKSRQNHPARDPDDDDQKALPESASKVAPDAAVITVEGLCTPATAPAENSHPTCQTQISRADFEKLVDAVLANKQALSRQRQLANAYPSLLAMAQAADARGVENSPRFQQRIAFARLQILSQELVRQIQADAANVPQKEIEAYYHEHSAEFDSATLERIYLPNHKRGGAPAGEKTEADLNQLAEKMRARAFAGESFLTLQKDAYAAAGMTEVPPNASLGTVHPNGLPPGHAFAFDLKVGEVSQLFSDSTGHYIYKLDAKTTGLSETTSDDIRRLLEKRHRDQAIQAIQQPITTELNPAYFGAADKPGNPFDPDSK